jgi:DNA polymerase-3 subunit epsilon
MNLIVFDTETNGFSNCSVLSISAIKVIDGKLAGKYNRFYYPIESYDYEAININKLDYKTVSKLRENSNYPKYFKDDLLSFYNFIKDSTHFVGHNIAYDLRFVKPINISHYFCTMTSNTKILKLKNKKNNLKPPKLLEVAQFYNVNYDNTSLHNSLYDVLITYNVFVKMSKFNQTRELISNFINNKGKKPCINFENNIKNEINDLKRLISQAKVYMHAEYSNILAVKILDKINKAFYPYLREDYSLNNILEVCKVLQDFIKELNLNNEEKLFKDIELKINDIKYQIDKYQINDNNLEL